MSDLLPSGLRPAQPPPAERATDPGSDSPTRAGPDPTRLDPAGPQTRSIWLHTLALAAVLGALLPLAGLGSVWSADEGALLYQATAVAEGRGWTFDHPFPEADPTGRLFPVHLSVFAPDGGYVVLGKHTFLVRLAGFVHGLSGYPGLLALSVGGAVAAAAATARLAARLDRRSAVPALWLVGLASPLCLSAYVAWAHTLAAALVAWALVGLTVERPTDRSLRISWAQVGGALALGAACLLRTEATLAAAATTLALTPPALTPPKFGHPGLRISTLGAQIWRGGGVEPGRGRVIAPLLAGLATVGGYALDRTTTIDRLGPVVAPGDRWGGLAGRVEGFLHTWLRPDFTGQPEHLLLLASATAVVIAALLARREDAEPGPVLGLLGLAVGVVLTRALISPVALIPGLVVAFPILFAGLALLRRADLDRPTALELGVFLVLFWGAVLAAQYRYGGGGEWGGRYFALGLPAAVALAAPALVRTVDQFGDRFGRRTQLRLVALGVTVTLVPVAMGLLGLRYSRDGTAAVTGRVDAALVDPGDGTGRPVVVTTMPALGRWAWSDLDRSRWLLVQDDADLPELGRRLRSLGVERFVFATQDAANELEPLAPWFVPTGPLDTDPTTNLDEIVIPLQATPSNG